MCAHAHAVTHHPPTRVHTCTHTRGTHMCAHAHAPPAHACAHVHTHPGHPGPCTCVHMCAHVWVTAPGVHTVTHTRTPGRPGQPRVHLACVHARMEPAHPRAHTRARPHCQVVRPPGGRGRPSDPTLGQHPTMDACYEINSTHVHTCTHTRGTHMCAHAHAPPAHACAHVHTHPGHPHVCTRTRTTRPRMCTRAHTPGARTKPCVCSICGAGCTVRMLCLRLFLLTWQPGPRL